jgi:transcriptional regulator
METAMLVPPTFRDDDLPSLHRMMGEARLANVVTATAEGIIATPVPVLIDEREGDKGTHPFRAPPEVTRPEDEG